MSVSLDYWAGLVESRWGSAVALKPLPGEQDLNFQVDSISTVSSPTPTPTPTPTPIPSPVRQPLSGVLKVMHGGCEQSLLELQVLLLARLAERADLPVPVVIPTSSGELFAVLPDEKGVDRLVWMISRLPGVVLAQRNARPAVLMKQIGHALASMDRALKDVEHPALQRRFKWNLCEAGWIKAHLVLIQEPARRSTLTEIVRRFEQEVGPLLERLPMQAIHNDINDHNVMVTEDDYGQPQLSGVIDFGDALAAPVLANVAIAAAYLMLDREQPVECMAQFVEAYCDISPLSVEEVEAIWPLALTRLAVSVVNSALEKRDRPDDPYVVISEAPAWRLLDQIETIDEHFVLARLRRAAGLDPDHHGIAVQQFLGHRRGSFAALMGQDLSEAVVLDLSPDGADSPDNPFDRHNAALVRRLSSRSVPLRSGSRQSDSQQPAPQLSDSLHSGFAQSDPVQTSLGRYAEPRLLYNSPAFRQHGHPAARRRTVHMGVDVFLPAGAAVYAPLAGIVCHAACFDAPQDYGGLVVLEHEVPDSNVRFHTLYGHLSHAAVQVLSVGQSVEEGETFATLGAEHENGGWVPHVHFQLGVLRAGAYSWDGVVDADQLEDWRSVFPNPAALLNLDDACIEAPLPDAASLHNARQACTAHNLKTLYREPLSIVRGWQQFLYDDRGRCYLDAYNNVPHVGHAHPQVVAAVSRQLKMLNTNTRYLHPALADYAQALTARLPDPLNVCFLVNSGSEANELAVRLARRFTGAEDVLVSEHGYHGITSLAIDVSHYKFAGKGGGGQKPWVHVAPVPDTFRGPHRGEDAGVRYAQAVKTLLQTLESEGRRACGFISEAFPSVGGQIVPPPGYLAAVYEHVHAHGGLAIADEVQTGLGRLGRFQWGFEQQQAQPDIVVLGKPIGNGHPLGAVITTRAIADAFDTGMELFSTFGGSTVSCVAGREVLRVLDQEHLADNAARVGDYLLNGLRRLAERFPLIGDVRGLGLFIGVELIEPDGAPATTAARAVVNALRDQRVLIGSDGPFDNVLKIRPPLCFSSEDADYLLDALEQALSDKATGAAAA